MEAETGGATRPSCPFADVRPEGCICIALADNKRISADYAARFCFTENHVRCRRFQRAVPEIPNSNESKVTALIDDPRAVAAVAILSVVLFLAIIATAFHGTWTGWLSGGGEGTATAQSASGVFASPTSVIIGSRVGSATAGATSVSGTQIPVLIVTPTPMVSTASTATAPAATTVSTPQVSTPTAVPVQTPPASVAVVPPVSIPGTGGPVGPNPPIASVNTSSTVNMPAYGNPPGVQTSAPGYIITLTSPAVHIVQAGETIYSIGAAYGVSTALIAVANNLTNPSLIMPGDQLFIPTPDGHLPPEAPLAGVHLVVAGDTMSSISQLFNVSVPTLMRFNALTDPDLIQVGDIIRIPKDATLASAAVQSTDIVQPGDTLFSIAQRYGVSVDAIMQANGLNDRNTLRIGQVLLIPSI